MLTLPRLDGEVLNLEATRFDGPLAVWTSYSATAEIEERAINDGLAVPENDSPLVAVTATVVPARLFLFDQPAHPAPGVTWSRATAWNCWMNGTAG